MPIFRRKNCIHAASGIFAVCKRLHSTLVESGLCALKLVDEIILGLCEFVVLFYVLFVLYRSMYCLCVNVYCISATGLQPNCS